MSNEATELQRIAKALEDATDKAVDTASDLRMIADNLFGVEPEEASPALTERKGSNGALAYLGQLLQALNELQNAQTKQLNRLKAL